MINYQVITSRGKPRFAVVDYQTFMKILEQVEGQRKERSAVKTGLKQTHVSLMEANKIKPRENTLNKLAEALNCSVDDLTVRRP